MTHDGSNVGNDVDDDALLLAHYIARGAEPWNVSLEASWLDYAMRAYVMSRLPERRPLRVCNVGIGVGLWDDWLGHVVGSRITSVDRDEAICRTFAVRQAREGHPYPAHVFCGDIRDGVLGSATFDVITCVGSTLAESGDGAGLVDVLRQHLAPGGILLGVAPACTSTNTDPRSMDPIMKDIVRCACTRINDPWRSYCSGCGTQLQPACGCGFVNAKGDAFCGGCGCRMTLSSRNWSMTDETTIPLDIIEIVS